MTGEQRGAPAIHDEPTGFDDLYRDEYLDLLRLARLLTGSLAIAEEVVHDSFETMIDRVDGLDNAGAYLRKVVVNNCYSVIRRATNERRKLEVVGARREDVVLPADLDETWKLVAGLKPRARLMLVLRYYDDQTIPQIADTLDVPEGTVKSVLHRALEQLRKEMTP